MIRRTALGGYSPGLRRSALPRAPQLRVRVVADGNPEAYVVIASITCEKIPGGTIARLVGSEFMDPMMIGAVLLAIVSGASEGLSAQLLEGAVSLIRRPFREKGAPDRAGPATKVLPVGKEELSALQQDPASEERAVALARVLLARAEADDDFRHGLERWWMQAGPIRQSVAKVANTISGGTQQGPVLQGRDFSNISFGVPPDAPPHLPSS